MRGVRPLSSVLKTMSLLDIIGASYRPLRLSHIADHAKMSPATTHQKLITLVRAGWLERTEEGTFRLSMHTNHIGIMALEQASLGDRVIPFLEKLAIRSNDTVSLAILERTRVGIVQRVESPGHLRAPLYVGASLSLSDSASGRVLIAFASDAARKRLRQSGSTLPNERLLARVRHECFAVSSAHSFQGIRAAAVPVFDARQQCAAALSLAAPLTQFSIRRARGLLAQTAEEITASFVGVEKR